MTSGCSSGFLLGMTSRKTSVLPRETETGQEGKKVTLFVHFVIRFFTPCSLLSINRTVSLSVVTSALTVVKYAASLLSAPVCTAHLSLVSVGSGRRGKKKTRRPLRRFDASRLKTIEEALAGGGKIMLLTHNLLAPRDVWTLWSETSQYLDL